MQANRHKYFMRVKRMGVVVLLSFSLSFFVSGCSSESLENELAYRQIGINYMNDGEYEYQVAFSPSKNTLSSNEEQKLFNKNVKPQILQYAQVIELEDPDKERID